MKQPATLINAKQLRQQMTDAELALWKQLRAKRFASYKFYRQRPIGRYIVDFYCHKVRLVVELDGSQHHTKDGITYDAIRTNFLNGLGLRVVRFHNRQVLTELDSVLKSIEHHLHYGDLDK